MTYCLLKPIRHSTVLLLGIMMSLEGLGQCPSTTTITDLPLGANDRLQGAVAEGVEAIEIEVYSFTGDFETTVEAGVIDNGSKSSRQGDSNYVDGILDLDELRWDFQGGHVSTDADFSNSTTYAVRIRVAYDENEPFDCWSDFQLFCGRCTGQCDKLATPVISSSLDASSLIVEGHAYEDHDNGGGNDDLAYQLGDVIYLYLNNSGLEGEGNQLIGTGTVNDVETGSWQVNLDHPLGELGCGDVQAKIWRDDAVCISDASEALSIIPSVTSAPIIEGSFCGMTVQIGGSSSEPVGTIIRLGDYQTEVTVDGTWQMSGLELSGGNSYELYAIRPGECSQISDPAILEIGAVHAPIASEIQSFCSIDQPTVSDLLVTGQDIKWYSTMEGDEVLDSSTALINNQTYFISQTVDGCESEDRLMVTAQIIETISLQLVSSEGPSSCEARDGLIRLQADVEEGFYDLSYSTGSFLGISFIDGIANIQNLGAGNYDLIRFSDSACQSVEIISVSLDCELPEPINQSPEALSFGITADGGTYEGNLLEWVSDPDGDLLFISIEPVTDVLNGELSIDEMGIFAYDAISGYEGSDSFEYEVCDDGEPSLCARAWVNITVINNSTATVQNDVLSTSSPFPYDRLQIEDIEDYPNNKVTVYNRWGGPVWEMHGYDNRNKAFLGKGNGSSFMRSNALLPAGTYYYIIDLGDGSKLIKGYLRVQ